MWKDKQDGRHAIDDTSLDSTGPGSPSNRTETGEDVNAFVGKGVVFKGTITYSGTVRIDGTLDGEVHTEGILLVGEEAVITAKVTAGTIICKGKITGDIHAKEKMKLRAPAVLNGGIKTPVLSIEEGVVINGILEMTQPTTETRRDLPTYPLESPHQSSRRVSA